MSPTYSRLEGLAPETLRQILGYLITPNPENTRTFAYHSDPTAWTTRYVLHPEVLRVNRGIHNFGKDMMDHWLIIELDESSVRMHWEMVARHVGYYGTAPMIVLDSEQYGDYKLPDPIAHIKVKFSLLGEEVGPNWRRNTTILVQERDFATVMRFLRIIDLLNTPRVLLRGLWPVWGSDPDSDVVTWLENVQCLQLVTKIDTEISNKSLKTVLTALEMFKGPLHEDLIAGGPLEHRAKAHAIGESAARGKLHPADRTNTLEFRRAFQPLAMAVKMPIQCVLTDKTPWLEDVTGKQFHGGAFHMISIASNSLSVYLLDFQGGTALDYGLRESNAIEECFDGLLFLDDDDLHPETLKLATFRYILLDLADLEVSQANDVQDILSTITASALNSGIYWDQFGQSQSVLKDPLVQLFRSYNTMALRLNQDLIASLAAVKSC
ncbi:hypothetical protein BU23DRAFT_572100 [Bimuria novae-zelandiae CBS 107.79]|uniref:Uncharacterized protein n=1 Tax=Bimuria novae-zelandiae CBS 107.79 TaxID=1447943 RepID=A0A6A5V0R7_9PLEO|nr:hypothetical protein BU23DRAFT_572100 [Bimuria novae-zelandiae CBS 107.79]